MFTISLTSLRSSYNKFVSKKNSLQTYSFLIRQTDNSKQLFRRFFFNHAGPSVLCLLVNKLLYSHGPRCYNKVHKNCSYGHCSVAPAKLMLLPRKPAALTLCLDLLHKCCIPASSHQQGISCRIMLITRGLGRHSDLGQAMITFFIPAMKGGDDP